MEEQQHNIDDIFRQGLSDYREAPPAAAWDDVERRLDGDQNKKPSFFRWPWIALLLLLVTGVIWYAVQSNNNDPHPEKTIAITAPHPAEVIPGNTPVREGAASSKQSAIAANEKNTRTTSGSKVSEKVKTIHAESAQGKNKASAGNKNSYAAKSHIASETRLVTSGVASQANIKKAKSYHASRSGTATNRVNASATPVHTQHAVTKAKRKNAENVFEHQRQDVVTKDAESVASENVTGKKPSLKVKSENSPVHQNSIVKNESVPKDNKKSGIADTRISQKEIQVAESLGSSSGKGIPPQTKSTRKTSAGIELQRKEPEVLFKQATKQTTVAPPVLHDRYRQFAAASEIKKTAIPPPDNQFQESKKRPADNIRQTPVIKAGNDTQASDNDDSNGGGGSTDSGEEETTKPSRKHRKRLRFSAPLSLDVLGGYEWGMQKPAPARGVASLRLMVKLSSGFSLGLQPAYRFGNTSNQQLSGNQVFGNVSPVQVDSSFTIDTFGRTNRYVIRQSYDSIRVPATRAGGKIWELELPLILSYETRNWHIYGGPSFNFGGKIVTTVSGTQQSFTISRRDSVSLFNRQLRADTFEHYFGTSTLTPYSTYKPEQAGDPSSLRIGYILGLGYQWKGFMLDVSLHQQLSGYNNMNATLQKIYGPYFRISLGYRIFGPSQQRKEKTEDDRKSLQRL